MNDYEVCEHVFVSGFDGSMVCKHCDLLIDSQLEQGFDQPRNYSMSGSKTSVLDAVEGVPIEVKTLARSNMIKKGENFVKKVRDDRKNTFKEIYIAYQELKIKFDPLSLAGELGLCKKDVNCCLKALSGTSLKPSIHDDGTEENLSIVILHPADYIMSLCEKNNLQKYAQEIHSITLKIVSSKKILLSSKPKHVACAIIKKYCDKHGIPAKSFGKTNKLADNALKKSIRDIEEFFD